ncbi:MAG: hypothetical protein R6X06_01960 [Gammaproteobacteria bacterium]
MANNAHFTNPFPPADPFKSGHPAFYHPIWDARISFTARGLLLMMVSHPWRKSFNFSELSSNRATHLDPETGVRRAIKELEKFGYVRQVKSGHISVARDVIALIEAVNKSKEVKRK